MRGEFVENTEREDFTLTKAVAIKHAIEPLLKAEAKARQAIAGPTTGRGKKATGYANLAQAVKGITRDKVAKRTGRKRTTLANMFPLMEGAARGTLVNDIKTHGVRDPLMMFEAQLLDGRNRWRAAEVAGVTITAKDIQQFDPKRDGDPLDWVISKNLKRRHLDEAQRAWVGSNIETLEQGRPGKDANLRVSREEAAKLLNVSARSINSAAFVRKNGAPELKHRARAHRDQPCCQSRDDVGGGSGRGRSAGR